MMKVRCYDLAVFSLVVLFSLSLFLIIYKCIYIYRLSISLRSGISFFCLLHGDLFDTSFRFDDSDPLFRFDNGSLLASL